MINYRDGVGLGRYQGPLHWEGRESLGIASHWEPAALPVGCLAPGGSQLSWLRTALVAQTLTRHNGTGEACTSCRLEGGASVRFTTTGNELMSVYWCDADGLWSLQT